MESIIRDHTVNFFENSYFSNKKCGFMKGRSTVLQLLKNMDDWRDRIRQWETVLFRVVWRLVLGSVSEFSDENMMDPYNLAICFGPTLLRVPANCDPVQHHPHIVDLIRNILIHQEDIFLLEAGDEMAQDGSTYYERCFIEEEEGCAVWDWLIDSLIV